MECILKLLIDADIVTFRAAFSAEPASLLELLEVGIPKKEAKEQIAYEKANAAWIANSRANGVLDDIAQTLVSTDFELWLSGKDNFRYGVYPEYKANRITAKRPRFEHEVKKHLVDQWGAQWSVGCEADDMLGVRQCMEHSIYDANSTIICTIDKDLDMIPGWHYNFVRKEKYYVTDEEAIKFFYYQCLVGDTADGIKGVTGIGPKKAQKLLDPCSSEAEYYNVVREQFGSYEHFAMTAKCLWIWREMNGIWKDNFLDRWPEESLYNECTEERQQTLAP
jgi:5'-3' exonuclease